MKVAALAACASVAACAAPAPPFAGPVVLGGVPVAAETLNLGHGVFQRYCATCHGADGRADTPAARQLDPRPRDFTRAEFKYASSPQPALPTDADLKRTVRSGVPGTAMPAWPNLTEAELDATVQYIKVFSDRWRAQRANLTLRPQTVLPAREAAASVPAGQSWQGDATPPPQTRLALRAAGGPPVARGER